MPEDDETGRPGWAKTEKVQSVAGPMPAEQKQELKARAAEAAAAKADEKRGRVR